MPAKTILTVLFLISLGVVVILGFRALPKRGDSNTPTTDEILVAAAALPPGTLLRAKDVVWHLSGTAEPDQILRPAGVAGKAEHIERSAGAGDREIGVDAGRELELARGVDR